MKFIGTEKSKVDKNATVYLFKVGKAEVIILKDILDYIHKIVPNSFFTMPFTSRLRDMRRAVHGVVNEHQMLKGRKRPKGWDPENPAETM